MSTVLPAQLPRDAIIDGRYRVLDYLGAGQAGSVYKVMQVGLEVERALKILDPKPPFSLDEKAVRGFTAEIKLLSRLTHRNVLKLFDAGPYTAGPGAPSTPYYVMELVHPPPGKDHPLTLANVFAESLTDTAFIDILQQLADGLDYIHSHHVLHADIKPPNILVEDDGQGRFDLNIADLGCAKALAIQPGAPVIGSTYLVGTELYAPPYAHRYVNKPTPISYAELQTFFPHYDFFCLGMTLAEVVSSIQLTPFTTVATLLEHPKPHLAQAFGPKKMALLKLIIRQLVADTRDNFADARQVKNALRKLRPDFLYPLGVPDMVVGGAHRVLSQPLERVYLSARAYELVRHPMFQRLHTLNQLNFVYLLYSGAHHSRFTHVCSAFETTKRYIEGLVGDPHFLHLMYTADYELLLASALLHDIGHYPLAHAVEDLRGITADGKATNVKADHEMVREFLDRSVPVGARSLGCILKDDWGIEPDRVTNVVAKQPVGSEAEAFVQSVVDGPIDVDKVSYLQYDSTMTGAKYGLGIDFDALIGSLIAVPPDTDRARRPHTSLGVTDKGRVAAEGVVTARYGMFSRVYWHHRNRSIMAMLQYAFARLLLEPESSFTFADYIDRSLHMSDLQALFFLCQGLGTLRPTNPRTGRAVENLLTGLLDGSRGMYVRLIPFPSTPVQDDDLAVRQHLIDLKKQASMAGLEILREELLQQVSGVLKRPLADSDLLFDIPRIERGRDTVASIWVRSRAAAVDYEELKNLSGIVKQVGDNFDRFVKKCRVFVSPAVFEELRVAGRLDEARKLVRSLLHSAAKKSG